MGEKHIFIRFEECNIHCTYCDELGKPAEWMSLDEVVGLVKDLEKEKGPHQFISLTGGEPLIYLPFLKPLIIRLKHEGFKIYLETGGILWKPLEEIIDFCDCVAMDIKTPSVTHEGNFDAEHAKFLEISRHKELFVKFVISKEIDEKEFIEEIRMVGLVDPNIPVVLMPISAEVEGHEDIELMTLIERLQKLSLQFVQNARVVPRFHKILNIR